MFTSDNWDPFEEGLVNIYGFLETPQDAGIGRKPYPILVPYPNLKYAKVSKEGFDLELVDDALSSCVNIFNLYRCILAYFSPN